MFQLEQAVNEWCQSLVGNQFGRESKLFELKDHLYCEIERLKKSGLSDEESFLVATKRLGDSHQLLAEFDKNKSVFDSCSETSKPPVDGVVTKCDSTDDDSKIRDWNAGRIITCVVAYCGLLAITVFALKRFIPDSNDYAAVISMLYFVWMIPLLMYPNFRKSMKAECRMLRRMFGKLTGN